MKDISVLISFNFMSTVFVHHFITSSILMILLGNRNKYLYNTVCLLCLRAIVDPQISLIKNYLHNIEICNSTVALVRIVGNTSYCLDG